MGSRGDGPRKAKEDDQEERVLVSLAIQGNGPRPYKIMDAAGRNNVLLDSRGRPRMFSSPENALRAAQRDGVALIPGGVRRPVFDVLRRDK